MYRIFTKIMPKKLRDSYIEILKYNNIKINSESFLGLLIFLGMGLSLGLSFFISYVYHINYFLMFIGLFLVTELFIFSFLNLKADNKSKFVENVLPDFLQLMSSNLRAGMTTDRALLLSAREEFGLFQEEINRLGKEISTGKEIDVALIDLSHRIRSEKLEKTVLLLVNGIRSGGQLAELLDQTAYNLRSQKVVEEKIRSNVLMYVIFIFIAVVFGAPLLFGLSTYLVEVLTKNIASIELPEETLTSSIQMPFNISKVGVSTSFIMNYAIFSLIITSSLGSLVIGTISKGKAKYGLRFMPIIVVISLVVFFIVRTLVSSMLGGLFGTT